VLQIDTKHARPSNEAYFGRRKKSAFKQTPCFGTFLPHLIFSSLASHNVRHHTAEGFIFSFYSTMPCAKRKNQAGTMYKDLSIESWLLGE
jgi:hypothetical protein